MKSLRYVCEENREYISGRKEVNPAFKRARKPKYFIRKKVLSSKCKHDIQTVLFNYINAILKYV